MFTQVAYTQEVSLLSSISLKLTLNASGHSHICYQLIC